MLKSWSLHHGDMNDIIYDAEGANKGRYGCTRADIGSREVDMGSRERAVMGLESRAVSALVTKHFVTIFCKT